MRIIFMGTPEFAVAVLDRLLKNKYNIVAVVTAPDKPSGRGQQVSQSAVKKYAIENDLKLLQPQNLKAEDFIEALKDLKADVQIVVAFRMLPEKVWNMPPAGTYNLHASLLPKYRGAAPINHAIICGDHESGVTTFKLKHEVDTGNILLQRKVEIKITDTAGDLHNKLMQVGADLMLQSVEMIQLSLNSGSALVFRTQDNHLASHAPKIFKDDCKINWHLPAFEIYNLVRGLSPYPTAFTQLKNGEDEIKMIKIFFSDFKIIEHCNQPGMIDTDHKDYLNVFCTNGFLEIKDLQLEGKKRMPVHDFLKGFKIKPGAKLLS